MPFPRETALRDFLDPFCLRGLRGVEIGPYDRPFLSRKDYPMVEYADVFTTEQLRKHASLNPKRNPSAVVSVDHVLLDQRLCDVVPHGTMDYVFCSHVLEHVPDFIAELKSITQVLKPDGLLLCAYPDRRFTFDVRRKMTSFETLVKRHADKLRKPEPATVYDYFVNYCTVSVGRIWQGLPDAISAPTYSADEAAEKAKQAETQYVDVHCNLFSDEEFRHTIRQLRLENICQLEVEKIVATRPPFNEFFVAIRNR
jgi:SAM-dependent methyltransferase